MQLPAAHVVDVRSFRVSSRSDPYSEFIVSSRNVSSKSVTSTASLVLSITRTTVLDRFITTLTGLSLSKYIDVKNDNDGIPQCTGLVISLSVLNTPMHCTNVIQGDFDATCRIV